MTGAAFPAPRPSRIRHVVAELGPVVGLTLALAMVAAAFVVPWLPSNPVRGSDLDRYAPVRDGAAYLSVERGPDGAITGWRSENVRRVPGLRASSQWRSGPAGALAAHVAGDDDIETVERSRRLERVDALEVIVRDVGPDGMGATDIYSVLDAEGQWLLAVHDITAGTETVLDPPLLVRPRDLATGTTWETTGALGAGGARYRSSGEVTEAGAHGVYDDCIHVVETFEVSVDGEVASTTSTRSWSCAGVGAVVDAVDLDASGVETATRALVATDRVAPRAEDLPDVSSLPTAAACPAETDSCGAVGVPGDPADWSLSRLGSAHRSFSADEATISPVWIPTDPPLVLAAARGGDLVAFDAATGDTVWRFHPAGTIQGAPVYADGRILFGATDKRVYALDTRGLFLWAHATSDSVATRPVVVDDLVVVGSEDRDVHALDLATGAPVWRVGTGGPIGSSPALVDGVVVIGSDDGALRLIEPADGSVRATVDVGGPVVAAVAGGDGVAVAGTTGGDVALVDVDSGDVRWSVTVGGAVRSAPVVRDGAVHVVDDAGGYTMLAVEDGSELLTLEGEYTGTPAVLEHGVLLTTSTGRLELVVDGSVVRTWDASEAAGVGDAAPSFALGPSVGGGAVWTVDRGGVVRRLGPTDGSTPVVDLAAAWLRTLTDEPFSSAGSPPLTTPVSWEGRAIGLDGGGNVYATDPVTGDTELLGTLSDTIAYAAPAVAGDVLLVPGGESLQAVELPGMEPLWQVAGAGATARPPVVVGDLVLYASGAMGDDAAGEVRLMALDVRTGREIWRAPLGPVPLAGGVVAVGDAVVGGTPLTAYEVATGAVRWRSDVTDEATLGTPGVTPDGATVVSGTLAFDGSDRSTLRAVDATTGDLRWEIDLGEAALDLTETVHLTDGIAVVPTLDGAVLGHRLTDGAEAWNYRGPVPVFGNVTLDGEDLWLATESGQVAVLDAASGEVRARFTDLDFPLESQSRAQAPGRVGDHVLVSFGYLLVGLDAAHVR